MAQRECKGRGKMVYAGGKRLIVSNTSDYIIKIKNIGKECKNGKRTH